MQAAGRLEVFAECRDNVKQRSKVRRLRVITTFASVTQATGGSTCEMKIKWRLIAFPV
jgi:hypothetical protein